MLPAARTQTPQPPRRQNNSHKDKERCGRLVCLPSNAGTSAVYRAQGNACARRMLAEKQCQKPSAPGA